MDIEKIKNHYQTKIMNSDNYKSKTPVNDLDLLYPEFLDTLISCFQKYNEDKPEEELYIVESYRSNELQIKYFRSGKSKISQNSMHHYGLAADVAFNIGGEFTYKGDYELLRKIFQDAGLTVLRWELGHVQYVKVSEQKKVREELDDSI